MGRALQAYRKMKLKTILSVLLILSLTFVVLDSSEAEAQAQYSLDLLGYAWDHSTISVRITPPENESWWKPYYLYASLRAISEWNHAIQEFASDYSNFSYLSRIRLVPTITQETDSGFDIYIIWTECCISERNIGQSHPVVKSPCIMTKNTVIIAARAPSGHVMTEVDMQNLILHEIGHTLGLYHSNYSGDIMYPTVSYRETVYALSSLDVYAVSKVFEWMSNSTQFSPSNTCPQESSVTLPSSISYQYLPIPSEALPSQTPIEYIIRLLLRPEILIALLIAVTMLAFLVVSRRRREEPQEILTEDTLSQEMIGLRAHPCAKESVAVFAV